MPVFFGVGHAGQCGEKLLLGIHKLDGDFHACKGIDDALRLALAHQGAVNEGGFEAVAQGAMSEDGYEGAIDAAAERIDGLCVTHGPFDLSDLFFDEFLAVHYSLLANSYWVVL